MLLTSTRAVSGAPVDALSDHDVILILRDIAPFVADRRWLGAFGDELVTYWDPVHRDETFPFDVSGNVVQYRDELKIDFTLWPVGMLAAIAAAPALPAELDAGYRVLLDRDGVAERLFPPTYTAHLPLRPDEAAFHLAVNDFFTDVPYVVKCLLRGDLFPAKWALDHDMKHVYLLPMLEWWVGWTEDWSRPVGSLGKGIQRRLPPDLWREVEGAWAGADPADSAAALFRTVAVYRRVAVDVADRLGFAYPHVLDRDVTAFARRMLDADDVMGGG